MGSPPPRHSYRPEVARARDPGSVAEAIRTAVASGVGGAVEGLIAGYHPIDIAYAIEMLEPEERREVFRLMEAHDAAVVLEEVEDHISDELVEHTEDEELAEIIDAMPPDAGADIVSRLDDEQAQRVLELMPDEESDEIEELLEYPEDSAGGLMTTEYVAVPAHLTAGGALERMRASGINPEGAAYVYVVDEARRLIGVIDVRQLVTLPSSAGLGDSMTTDLITARPDTDREELGRLVDKYDLLAVPVVNELGVLLGTVTHDDVVDAISEEHTEDVLRMAGTDTRDLLSRSSLAVALIRLPWLSISLAGSITAATIVKLFGVSLGETLVLLAAFIPVVTAMGGNSGLQSATIVVRSLALGTLQGYGIRRLFVRELLTAALMGLVCGLVVGAVGWAFFGGPQLGLVVGLSMFVAITWAATVGTFVPILFDRLGADPALASGPLTTMLNDVFGLIIYLGLATLLLNAFRGM
ncbi:MAG: magnesium transporter [Armatimonadetes bacterium]|nr:magnesium transporter [Armatimonadota bacterium]